MTKTEHAQRALMALRLEVHEQVANGVEQIVLAAFAELRAESAAAKADAEHWKARCAELHEKLEAKT